jgi:hypothetical protein
MFTKRCQKFCEQHLGFGSAARKRGLLGRITDYVVRYEVQSRHSLHAHILLWVHPDDRDLVASEIVAEVPAMYTGGDETPYCSVTRDMWQPPDDPNVGHPPFLCTCVPKCCSASKSCIAAADCAVLALSHPLCSSAPCSTTSCASRCTRAPQLEMLAAARTATASTASHSRRITAGTPATTTIRSDHCAIGQAGHIETLFPTMQ